VLWNVLSTINPYLNLNMYKLQNKHVLVTGGAKGIGKAIVERFLKEGCQVDVLDNDPVALESIKELGVATCLVDISNKDAVQQLRTYNFDVLVNNAAITIGDDYGNIMKVNCDGTRYVTEAVLQGMKKQGHGNIIFISSVHTAVAFVGDAAYDMSKRAIEGYLSSRAIELARYGIRINAVAPGVIEGAGTQRNMTPEMLSRLGRKVPIQRCGRPDEIANVVAWLASEESSYLVGAIIRADGGLPLQNVLQD